MTVDQPAIFQVPTDVWQRICDHFTTREWVTSFGLICKHFHEEQPLRIDPICPSYGVANVHSIVRWMLHHWMNAQAIDLKVLPPIKVETIFLTTLPRLLDLMGIGALFRRSQKQDVLRSSPGAGAESLVPAALRVFKGTFISHLTVFKAMMTHDVQEWRRAWLLYLSKGPKERACARLLPLMSRLTALNLFIPRAPQLPPFNDLEHLELHSIDFEGVQQSLPGLRSLKTLFLSCEVLEALLPELHLAELPDLRHVRLDDVFPAALSLPHGCRLDVHGNGDVMGKVIGAAWQDALQHLHACTCKWTGSFYTPYETMHVQALPSFLSMAAGSIQELTLIERKKGLCHYARDLTIQLDPANFCNLKKLSVRSQMRANIHIPAAVRPASLHVQVFMLSISFEDAIISCANLTDVNVLYLSFIPAPIGCAYELLQGPLARYGVSIRLLDAHHNRFKLVTSNTPSPPGDFRVFQNQMSIYNGAPPCSCSLCWACMKL